MDTTWVLVFWLFFPAEDFMKVEIHRLDSLAECQDLATQYVPENAAATGAGGAKWQCVPEGSE